MNKFNVAVPNVVGSTQAGATTAINQALLKVGNVTTAKSTNVPADSVISTNPQVGVSVAAGSGEVSPMRRDQREHRAMSRP